MHEKFQAFNLRPDRLKLIGICNEILADLYAQGYTLTLRQLYYQLVSKGVIENKQLEYKNLGVVMNKARLCGLTDWDWMEDRTRNLQSVSHWKNPASIVEAVASQFRLDKWADQDCRIEVWVEKDALVGVVERACRLLDVAWFSCRGYVSQSELYFAGKRLARYYQDGQIPVVVHLGDHDPSGIDMSRDIGARLSMFAENRIEINRVALTMDQIEEFQPPPNPAKSTDTRFAEYEKLHGDESWELDALTPSYIDNLIQETVKGYRDEDKWLVQVADELTHRNLLAQAAKRWPDVVKMLQRKPRKKKK